jgi:DNA polymerase III alpha subunit
VVPLFKTEASIGKSLLTTQDVLDIQEKHDLKQVVVVEDSFYNFRKLNSSLLERGVNLIFGIRLPVVQEDAGELKSYLVFFAKNNNGIKQLRSLYSKAYCSEENLLILKNLKKEETSDIKIGVPFYDSFIYQNLFNFGLCNIQLKPFDHFYIEEDNGHPFDSLIQKQLSKINGPKIKAKTILYKDKEDVTALQFYKAVCNRSNGKPPTYGNPNLSHFCSDEFCWESYLLNK